MPKILWICTLIAFCVCLGGEDGFGSPVSNNPENETERMSRPENVGVAKSTEYNGINQIRRDRDRDYWTALSTGADPIWPMRPIVHRDIGDVRSLAKTDSKLQK